MMKVQKRNGDIVDFDAAKIESAMRRAFSGQGEPFAPELMDIVENRLKARERKWILFVEDIQDTVEEVLMRHAPYKVAKAYVMHRERHAQRREYTNRKMEFIEQYKASSNTANATIDDNSNVGCKNIGVLNSEIHKQDNMWVSRSMVERKLKELYPDFNYKQYVRDIESHIIYKNDEKSFAGAIAPYCASITMYPFLTGGIKGIGGLSAAPRNIDSFCGIYINLIFATSAMFAGAVATPEFLLCFDYFARKEWGDDYWTRPETVVTAPSVKRQKTIVKQIHQYWEQVVYSINQPTAARGLQSAFVNFSYFDKPFFDGMFGNFVFPDGTAPQWESLKWLQKEFMMWFNNERLRCMLTFPVESVCLLHHEGKFEDEGMARFVAEEYARGHSFFTYLSDSVDSLSSCCRLRNKIQTKEFNFTNGNIGVQTGSKSVISLNLSRICQEWAIANGLGKKGERLDMGYIFDDVRQKKSFETYLGDILERVYKYHNAYNELMHDMYDAGLLPVYKAGFINLDKQYLTIGLNGLNQAAEYFGMRCTDNADYRKFCQLVFGFIKDSNAAHKTKRTNFNTEQVPAESLAVKNYNWDKNDGYWVPDDTNLYASYVFKPNEETDIYDKIRLHGTDYIGDYLDGGAAAHINLTEHLTANQYANILTHSAKSGCSYLTFNIPNSECRDCGHIVKAPVRVCPKCGSTNIDLYDRIIGYLTRIRDWAEARQYEHDHHRLFTSPDGKGTLIER